MMEQNVGLVDRYVRIGLGSLLVAAGAASMARRGGLGAVLVGALGGMMLAEGVLGTCPLYSLYGVNTNRDGDECCCECDCHHSGEPDTNDVIQPYEGI